MKNIFSAPALLFFALCSGLLYGLPDECRAKCGERFTRCSNDCAVAVSEDRGCGNRCGMERRKCEALCGSPGSGQDDREAELDEEPDDEAPPGDDFNDLDELEELENDFDGVDGMQPDDDRVDLIDRKEWDAED